MHLKKIKVSDNGNMVEPSSKYLSAPSFYINAEQMSEMKGWEVGGKYQMVIDVEMKSKNEREDSMDGSFEIVGYKYIPKKSIDEMTDDEFGEYQSDSLNRGALQ